MSAVLTALVGLAGLIALTLGVTVAEAATPTPLATTVSTAPVVSPAPSPSTLGSATGETTSVATASARYTSVATLPTRPPPSVDPSADTSTTVVATRPPTPPASATSVVPIGSVVVAVAVLIAVSLVLIRIARPSRTDGEPRAGTPPSASEPGTEVLVGMAIAGEALIDAGFDVNDVQSDVGLMGRAFGVPEAEVVVLPTAVLVSARAGGQLRTGVVSSGRHRLRLHQTEDLVDVVRGAQQGAVEPGEIEDRIASIRAERPPFPPGLQLVGQALTAMGLALILGTSWLGLGVSAVLGAVVGALSLVAKNVSPRFEVLVNVGTSFTVAAAVFLLARTGMSFDVVPCLIAPLVTLLPGALLTTAVIELVTGQMISGAGRLAAGAAQLVLLGVGILTAAALVGVPAVELSEGPRPLGSAGPWLAVAVFGVGIVVNQCARATSLGWILLVLYVAYGAQVLGGLAFGGVLSAFVGAAAMTPVAALVARQPSGPPVIVSFTPAFWLLVPGALGLVGVAALLHGDSSGLSIVTSTVETMVAIALGVLVGRALSLFVADRPRASATPSSPRNDV